MFSSQYFLPFIFSFLAVKISPPTVHASAAEEHHFAASLPYVRFKWPSNGLISSSNNAELEIHNVYGAMGDEVSTRC